MSELGDKRTLFTKNIYLLLGRMYERGYSPRFDIEHENHMAGSLHYKGLAKDILLFKDGLYLSKTEDHREFGEYWESLGGSWGGRFSDGNHYSIAYGGKK